MVIGVAGYGNLGRSVVKLAMLEEDVEIAAVFTTRDKTSLVDCPVRTESCNALGKYKGKIDCMILCYGASGSLKNEILRYLPHFNTVDSFDNHSEIESHLKIADKTAKNAKTTAVISSGWDPGLLSLARLLGNAFIPRCSVSTFWGEGISQGHTEALKRVPGVKDAIEFTVPKLSALERARKGEYIDAKAGHLRVCYISAEEKKRNDIIDNVLSLEGYFKGYDTEIHFVDEDVIEDKRKKLFHKGRVIASGSNASGSLMELYVEMGCNPDFTAAILIATSRAAVKINREQRYGAFTLFDLPPKYLISDENVLSFC